MNHSKLYSLDDESLNYMESIPKNKRSQTVREALKLHKFQHREQKKEKNSSELKLKVNLIG